MAETASVHVEVSTELLAGLGKWSEPVQVKITSDGKRYDMIFRRVICPPPDDVIDGWDA